MIELETPPSKLALVLSPPSSFFTQTDGGGSFNGVGTRPVSKDLVHVPDPSRTMSRYQTISSRSEREWSHQPSSHGSLNGEECGGHCERGKCSHVGPARC